MTTAVDPDLELWGALARDHLGFYGHLVHQWRPFVHHQEWIEKLEDESVKYLLIVAPPSSAKTSWAGIVYTAWAIGRDPNLHIGYITNSDDMSVKRSMAVRDTIGENPRYRVVFPDLKPDTDKGWGQRNWYVWRQNRGDKDATFHAAGLYGQIIGDRYDLMIVDDVCDQESVQTQLQRDKTWEWFNKTLRSRLTKDGRLVVIMTRWHHDDLAARLIEQGWPLLHVPALERGISYWPEEWPVERLIAERDGQLQADGRRLGGIGSRAFEAQYQGRPTAEEGNILKWFPTYAAVPALKTKLHRWDTAWGETQTADYSAMVSLGLGVDNNLYVLSGWQDRLDTPEVALAVDALAEREKPTIIVVEEAARAKEVVRAVRKASGRDITTEPVPQKMDKVARANAAAPTFECGRVLFPARWHSNYGPWVEELIEQCKRFPVTGHFDMADALIGGVLRLTQKHTERKQLRWG